MSHWNRFDSKYISVVLTIMSSRKSRVVVPHLLPYSLAKNTSILYVYSLLDKEP